MKECFFHLRGVQTLFGLYVYYVRAYLGFILPIVLPVTQMEKNLEVLIRKNIMREVSSASLGEQGDSFQPSTSTSLPHYGLIWTVSIEVWVEHWQLVRRYDIPKLPSSVFISPSSLLSLSSLSSMRLCSFLPFLLAWYFRFNIFGLNEGDTRRITRNVKMITFVV